MKHLLAIAVTIGCVSCTRTDKAPESKFDIGPVKAQIFSGEGDMCHARLFGYVITDQNGELEMAAIQPAGYPQSDLTAHIHLSMWKDSILIPDVPGELLFEDDERLTPERRKRALRDGFLTVASSGTAESPVYSYQFTLKL